MKTWIKGGLIGAVLFILLFIISIPLSGGYYGMYLALPIITLLRLLTGNFEFNSGEMVILIISSVSFYFIIGAIIGLIVGKIKSKNLKSGK